MHIALIAHDARKPELLALAAQFRDVLRHFTITATAGTGLGLRNLGLTVQTVLSGPEGGDLEIGSMVAHGRIDAVVFFRDEETEHAHEADIAALLRICAVRHVPIANTRTHARKVLQQASLAMQVRGIGSSGTRATESSPRRPSPLLGMGQAWLVPELA